VIRASWPRSRGLGFCRRPEVASHLAARLAEHPPDPTARAVADAIGFLGSSWAWEALGSERVAEGLRMRQMLTHVLLAAWPGYEAGARKTIGHALLELDHPSLPGLLADLRGRVPPAQAEEVRRLEARVSAARRASP
jgi:hypothetical protein